MLGREPSSPRRRRNEAEERSAVLRGIDHHLRRVEQEAPRERDLVALFRH